MLAWENRGFSVDVFRPDHAHRPRCAELVLEPGTPPAVWRSPPLAPLTEAPASVVRFLKERERSQSSDMDTTLEIAKRAADFRMEWSPVHDTMRRLAQTLGARGIPFAIAGAMAANAHRHRRTTAVEDVKVRREDLVRFKDRWIGHGWLDFFEGSKGFRDTFRHPRLR